MGEMNLERWEATEKPEAIGLTEIDWETWKQWAKENNPEGGR